MGADWEQQRASNSAEPPSIALNSSELLPPFPHVSAESQVRKHTDRSLTRKRSLVRSQYRPPAFVQLNGLVTRLSVTSRSVLLVTLGAERDYKINRHVWRRSTTARTGGGAARGVLLRRRR